MTTLGQQNKIKILIILSLSCLGKQKGKFQILEDSYKTFLQDKFWHIKG